PGRSFRHPEDAAHQIASALESARRRFGSRPEGMWPSEGSLSERALQLMGEQGVRWTASDENVLRASLPEHAGDPDLALRPWRIDPAGGASPVVFFRDQELSDRIGFVYSTWPARAAADDFVGRLRAIAARAPGGVVSVILDGENAWEHYPDNGVEFLSALYAGLTGADEIETVTFSQAAASGPEPGLLPSLRAGSWIGASFTTWIGHPEKNRAWELLTDAREEAARRLGPELSAAPVRTLLSAAEGSDWFWWFGEDHFSEQDAIFDAAFRDLLRGVYERLQAPVPAELDQPIKQGRAATWRPPSGPVRPTLDGAVTDYFEWLAAGTCEAASGEGTMHYASGLIRRVLFGVAGGSLFVRVDPERGDIRALLGSFEGASLNVVIHAPASESIRFRLEDGRVTHAGSTRAVRYAARQVLELEIPLAELPARTPPAPVPAASPGDPPAVVFHVRLDASAGMVQRLPRDGAIAVPAGDLYDWSA
ncbi:MAG TPA: glycoside hydrolase family 57 protein, partial [Candidatus Polarisedimenticolia bacterium]|nr:glycoside hydrolase family 57 protein [Candidatus Polarisedimenticolia bacterium]